MGKIRLSVKEIISSTTADDDLKGNEVYEKIIESYSENKENIIILDFEKIELVNTAFLNNAIGKLFDRDINNVDLNKIRFANMDDLTVELLKESIMVAQETYKAQNVKQNLKRV